MQVLLEELDLAHVVLEQLREHALRLLAHLVEQLGVRLREPARNQLRLARDGAVGAGQRGDDDQDAVLREVAPVAQRDVLHVPHAEPVNERDAGLDPIDEPRHPVLELDYGAVLGQDDAVFCNPTLAREPGVRGHHPELTVHGHHRARPNKPEHRSQLLGVAMARHMNRGDLLVQDLGAPPRKLVDRVVDAQLVPRHRLGRDDHRVPRLDLDGRVVAVGDAHERRERLALTARAEDQDLARCVLL